MTILGIGTDIIEINRMRKIVKRHGLHFLCRLFSEKERKYCNRLKDPSICYAGRFAAKEAIVKALGTGFGKKINWQDIEITNEKTGKPIINLSKKALEEFNNPKIMLSISHCVNYATASAIWQK